MGIEISRSLEVVFLCPPKYSLNIFTESEMLGCNPINTPVKKNHRPAHTSGDSFEHTDEYCRLVGCLVHLSVTRPGLIYFVHGLANFELPLLPDWDTTLRVLRYLKGSPGKVFCYVLC